MRCTVNRVPMTVTRVAPASTMKGARVDRGATLARDRAPLEHDDDGPVAPADAHRRPGRDVERRASDIDVRIRSSSC